MLLAFTLSLCFSPGTIASQFSQTFTLKETVLLTGYHVTKVPAGKWFVFWPSPLMVNLTGSKIIHLEDASKITWTTPNPHYSISHLSRAHTPFWACYFLILLNKFAECHSLMCTDISCGRSQQIYCVWRVTYSRSLHLLFWGLPQRQYYVHLYQENDLWWLICLFNFS